MLLYRSSSLAICDLRALFTSEGLYAFASPLSSLSIRLDILENAESNVLTLSLAKSALRSTNVPLSILSAISAVTSSGLDSIASNSFLVIFVSPDRMLCFASGDAPPIAIRASAFFS